MKGVELPVNAIIIILLCIAVLLAVITMFFGVWKPGQGSISLEAAKGSGCQMLSSLGCGAEPKSIPIRGFDANQDGSLNEGPGIGCKTSGADNLQTLCNCWYGSAYETAEKCRKICGCAESSSGSISCTTNQNCCRYGTGGGGSCVGVRGTCSEGKCLPCGTGTGAPCALAPPPVS